MTCGCGTTSCTTSVFVGVTSPEAHYVEVYPWEAVPDLSVVTGVTSSVTRPDGVVVVWAYTIVEQSAHRLRLRHLFAAGDVNLSGQYQVLLTLTLPAAATVRLAPQCIEATPWVCAVAAC